jgi:protoporphyrinogen oxidase
LVAAWRACRHDRGNWVDFPLSPWNLLKRLGPHVFVKAGFEVIGTKFGPRAPGGSFESFALNTYGRTIAQRFLLNYSEKLWGRPCHELSPSISGKRLEGLNLKTFFIETLLGERSKTKHLDGAFFYPDHGIGMIADGMVRFCGPDNVCTNSRITRILHREGRITEIEVNGAARRKVGHVVSTIPLNHLIQMLDPAPPAEILRLASALSYRHVVLAAFVVHKPRLSLNASTYFPAKEFPFTRIYEPKQRSPHMSHPDKTMLVAEIACSESDPVWSMPDSELRAMVEPHLLRIGWCSKRELGDMCARRMPHAYPVQSLEVEAFVRRIHDYCSGFSNLEISGRNGCFSYIHLHDLLRLAREIIRKIPTRQRSS